MDRDGGVGLTDGDYQARKPEHKQLKLPERSAPASQYSALGYLKVAALWLVGLLVTHVLAAVVVAFSLGFGSPLDYNSGFEGSKAWAPAIVTWVIAVGVLTARTVSIVRKDHRRGGTMSGPAIAVSVCVVLALLAALVVAINT